MFKIKVITIGKVKEEWLRLALEEYKKRISSSVQITWALAKDEKDFLSQCENEGRFVCFDSRGELLTSEEYSKRLSQLLEQNGCRLTFLIGGPEGIHQTILKRAIATLSFSRLTFTHQIVRLIFIEQLYRSMEILANSAYHK
jgi:23S rRNA (pseudouridine1915-N3)-methyltransferase